MATQVDLPVRVNGKTCRFIANGEKAGIFEKGGALVQSLVVTETSTGRQPPKVETLSGDPFELRRGSRPCSCTGAPWNVSYRDLAAQL